MTNIVSFVTDLFNQGSDVSDIHFREGRPVRVRMHGTLISNPNVIPTREGLIDLLFHDRGNAGVSSAEELAAKVLGRKEEHDFSMSLGGVRARGTLFAQDGGKYGVALRRIPGSPPTIDQVGLPDFIRDRVAEASKGLFLVTGATGSGKSTTLAAAVRHINENSARHILTLEDPVEFVHEDARSLVTQRVVTKDSLNFGTGLRAAMRQDPDVIMIGELRDLETVKAAMDAANTGHLVLGTLHTMSASQTVDRALSFFPAEDKEWAAQVLASVLIGVMSQVLVPKINGGRQLCYELMVNTIQVRNHIQSRNLKNIFNEMDTGSSMGHVLLNRNLEQRVKEGVISMEDAAYVSYDPTKLSFWNKLGG